MHEQHTMFTEEWRPVVGYEGLYEVSSLGRLRCLTRGGYLMRGCLNNGYRLVNLKKHGGYSTHSIHRLVAKAFLGVPPDGYECNHKDRVRDHNAVSNLEWLTPQENKRHAFQSTLDEKLWRYLREGVY